MGGGAVRGLRLRFKDEVRLVLRVRIKNLAGDGMGWELGVLTDIQRQVFVCVGDKDHLCGAVSGVGVCPVVWHLICHSAESG